MNIKQLIEELNKLNITQKDEWLGDVPQPYRDLLKGKVVVAKALDVDKHRHYETAVCVVAYENGYIGVRHCSSVFSEESSIDDVCWTLCFFEMETVQTVTYRPIPIKKQEITNDQRSN